MDSEGGCIDLGEAQVLECQVYAVPLTIQPGCQLGFGPGNPNQQKFFSGRSFFCQKDFKEFFYCRTIGERRQLCSKWCSLGIAGCDNGGGFFIGSLVDNSELRFQLGGIISRSGAKRTCNVFCQLPKGQGISEIAAGIPVARKNGGTCAFEFFEAEDACILKEIPTPANLRIGIKQRRLKGLLPEVSRFIVIHDPKAGGQSCFDGEELQQAFAESMNGLYFKAARCFQRLGKQPAGQRHFLGRLINSEIIQCRQQDVIFQGNPCRQAVKQPG